MEKESRDSSDNSMSDFGFGARQTFICELKRKENLSMMKKKRMQIINSEGNLHEDLKKEQEIFNNFENYLKLIGSMSEGDPELPSDRNLSMNASHVNTVSHILDTYPKPKFTHHVLNLGVHKALNYYLQNYLNNRNNPDVETSCAAALTIFAHCTQGNQL